jgi:DNA polymerase-3 subunit gamma/tau
MTVVLARKYRPQFFRDVIGQDIFVRMIRNALRQNLVGHGFLLTGIRGVGKTTLARLMAKALSCAHLSDDQEPCGLCSSCEAIVYDKHLDVVEIDAASHTGVDDIRQLIEGCGYKPVMGRYKIFIIDEVHMLSKNAFNALLKTLEEPPDHVKFILATTEINKVPLTIVSRCQQLHLKRVAGDVLVDHLKKVCLEEKFAPDYDALEMIANASDGGVRDALVLLERALLLSNDHVLKGETVRTLMAIPDGQEIQKILEYILIKDIQGACESVQKSYQSGIEPRAILEKLLDVLHSRIAALMQGKTPPLMQDRPTISLLDRMWQLAYKGWVDIAHTPFPLPHLEIILMRMAYLGHFPSPEELLWQAESTENRSSPSMNVTSSGGVPTNQLKNLVPHKNALDPFAEQKKSENDLGNDHHENKIQGDGTSPSSTGSAKNTSLNGASSDDIKSHPPRVLDAPQRPNDLATSVSSSPEDFLECLSAHEGSPHFIQNSRDIGASYPINNEDSLSKSEGNPHQFSQLLNALQDQREALLYTYLAGHVIFVSWASGKLYLKWVDASPIPSQITAQLQTFLKTWTGTPHHIVWVDHAEGTTLKEQEHLAHEKLRSQALEHPLLKAAKLTFPDFILEETTPL